MQFIECRTYKKIYFTIFIFNPL